MIFALDGIGSRNEVGEWISRLMPIIRRFKVGKELFTREGPGIVEFIHERGGKVFLDLKYHDIPETVRRAVEAAGALGVEMLDVHALGGRRMMEAAREAAEQIRSARNGEEPRVVAVTVLTSMQQDDVEELGIKMNMENLVLHLAKSAWDAGLDGVVASPWEVRRIREEIGDRFLIVTPGVRTRGGSHDDQKRVSTPEEAVGAGADFIVVGRDIKTAKDPIMKAKQIESEITHTLAKRRGNG